MTPLLEARGVAVPGRLAPVDLTFTSSERVAVIGPNGSGKTSLLRALAGIEAPRRLGDGGDLRRQGPTPPEVPAFAGTTIDGEEVGSAAPARLRQLLAFLPASREVAWPIPVRDVIALGLDKPDPERVDQLLAALELQSLADRRIDSLSTGERARALLARALAPRPRLLLLDEPLSNLDPAWALRTLELLGESAAEGSALLVSVHDLSLLAAFDRVLMLSGGALVADGVPADVLGSPSFGEVFGVEPEGAGWRLRQPADPRSSR